MAKIRRHRQTGSNIVLPGSIKHGDDVVMSDGKFLTIDKDKKQHTFMEWVGATCATAVGTAAKTITVADYTLSANTVFGIKYTAGNTANSPTISVNGSAAIPVQLGGQSPTGASGTGAAYCAANGVVFYFYDGANMVQFGSNDITDADTTYSAMSVAEGVAGTVTTSRAVRADYLKQIIQSLAVTTGADGKIDAALLPDLAVTDVFEAATQAAMLALEDAEQGDLCFRTDTSEVYILVQSPSSTPANWKKWTVPVQTSVSGNAGTATKLQTARSIGLSGDATGTVSFDGSANVNIPAALAAVTQNDTTDTQTAAAGGTITVIDNVTVDTKGRVTGKNKKTITLPAAPTTVTGNAGSATKLQTARTIDGVSFNGEAAITHYGSCSTAAGTVEKAVALTGFTLVTGARVTVKFTVTNTAANPTLNVNSTGAKEIYCDGTAIPANWLEANCTYDFIYNGTQYDMAGDDNNMIDF